MSRAVVKQMLSYIRVALESYLKQLQSLGIADLDKLLHSRDFEEFVWNMLQARASIALGLRKVGYRPTCDQVAVWLATLSEEEKVKLFKDIVEQYIKYLQEVRQVTAVEKGRRSP